MLLGAFAIFSNDLAIDLGTANTCVFARGQGIVLSEPSIVAFNRINDKIEAVGTEAKAMVGRTPGSITAIKPMRDGVIADFDAAEKMLGYFIKKAHGRRRFVRPRVVIGVPSQITQVERRAVKDSAHRAHASEVFLVEEGMARHRRQADDGHSERHRGAPRARGHRAPDHPGHSQWARADAPGTLSRY